ncbi:MAG: sensor hybrid histidine kinase [Betaproteobacteria bacterium]|nr:sensor hybrid histidine kinase [Betaproteobacteria bacterium]
MTQAGGTEKAEPRVQDSRHNGQPLAADLAEQVFREQVRLAFELLPVAIVANVALTLAVFAVLAQVVPMGELSAWVAAMLALIAVRAAALFDFRRTAPEKRDYRRYVLWYFLPYALTGLGWSVLATFIVPADNEIYAVLAMCAIYGLSAGGVAFLGHMRDLYGAYLLVTMLPAAAKWLALWWQFGGGFRLVMGLTTLVFVGLLYSAAHQLSRLVAGAVHARLEKEALARRLQELVATVERANQAKSDFIARMSRQVHAPTAAIVGQALQLLGDEPSAPRQAVLRELHDDAQSLLAMLGDVLDYSSLEAGQLQIERVEFDLRELLARAGAAGETLAAMRGLAFTCNIAAEVPARVLGDPRRLGQILVNLLSNAARYTDAGSVSLDVRQMGVEGARHKLVFAVRDTGIGIPAPRLGEIFQAFGHGEDGAQRKGGSGLGLAICRRLAGLMQGALAVESEPRRGSVFTLMLALTSADSAD